LPAERWASCLILYMAQVSAGNRGERRKLLQADGVRAARVVRAKSFRPSAQ